MSVESAVAHLPRQRVDVLIVGAGAAGCVYAARLAQAGRRVHVLEAGPAWSPGDLISSQLWARRLKWGGSPVLAGGADRFAHNAGMGWGTGGAALHHYGTWPRVAADAFEHRSRYGSGLDWGLTYAELRPWYDRVQKQVGIAGDAGRELWRPPGDPYPLPPIPTLAQGRLIANGFEKLGKAVAPLPLIINTEPYDNRPACLLDGWCDAGCPIGALGNPLFTYHRMAVAAGARFHHHCAATRILCDERGRPEGVRVAAADGEVSLYADVIVVAGSVVQTPRLLLASPSSRDPAGLGNRNGLVGRYLNVECMIGQYGLFAEGTENYRGVSAGQLTHRETSPGKARPGVPGGLQWQIAPAMKPNDLFGVAATRPDIHGEALHRFVREGSRKLGSMVGFAGGAPARDNRVVLATRRDRFGMPLPQLVHSFSPETHALWRYLAAQGDAVFRAAGASSQWQTPMRTGHITGGTLMGSDMDQSVTDSFGRLHDYRNVWLAGGGLIPACNGASPTYTIHALAERGAAELAGNWSRYSARQPA